MTAAGILGRMPRETPPQEIVDLADARAAARRAFDWETADRLKGEIEAAGWRVVDAASLYTLERAAPPDIDEGGRTRYVAFAGRFTGKLSNEEAAAGLRKFGDVYQDKVTDQTNYVVVAEGYEEHPNYKAALEYGIKILRENILMDYLGIRRD